MKRYMFFIVITLVMVHGLRAADLDDDAFAITIRNMIDELAFEAGRQQQPAINPTGATEDIEEDLLSHED